MTQRPVPTESALVVLVPALDTLVGAYRERHDPAAAWGVPAHVTVLYPFVPPSRLDAGVRARVAGLVESVPGFAVTYRRCRWFDDAVLWVEPEPPEPFARLTASVAAEFPEHPPYAGTYDPVPHLTVGHAEHAGPDELRAADAAVARALPITARVDAVALLTGSPVPGGWSTAATFPLAP